MDPHLITTLVAIAIVCIGAAVLIPHAIASRVLAGAGTIVAGVVLLYTLLT